MRRRAGRLAVAAVSATAALLLGVLVSPAVASPGGSPVGAHGKAAHMSAAKSGIIQQCEALSGFSYASTTITSAQVVPAGVLTNRGTPIAEHCLVTGRMNERVSAVDGQTYAIGFEMRLPTQWSGRYLYQANGGLDGSVATAIGGVGGGESGLQMGMAVISSDAGHSGSQNPTFGLDPQARLDYGYQAVGTLTPMAKALVKAAYGRTPDRSYMTGGSNGGRHTMVGAARYANQYDGFLAVSPGFDLPQAAVAQVWGAQQWTKVATSPDLNSAFTPAERQTVANAVLAVCDRLDGLADGMVQASDQCSKKFSVKRDVPTCEATRDGTCLTREQKAVVSDVFSGAQTSNGKKIYESFPLDPGIAQSGWGFWKFFASVFLDPSAVGYLFTTPPDAPALNALGNYALTVDTDRAARSIYQTSGIYTESAMQYMTPPNPSKLDTLRNRGAKMIVIHGTADGVFSPDDTERWYDEVNARYRNKADQFVRYFEVPGMGHVSGGPATDQYDALAALVKWVERGDAPRQITAWVNPANTELPAGWSLDRSRPLCPYPSVATYKRGDTESATSFVCTNGHHGPSRGR